MRPVPVAGLGGECLPRSGRSWGSSTPGSGRPASSERRRWSMAVMRCGSFPVAGSGVWGRSRRRTGRRSRAGRAARRRARRRGRGWSCVPPRRTRRIERAPQPFARRAWAGSVIVAPLAQAGRGRRRSGPSQVTDDRVGSRDHLDEPADRARVDGVVVDRDPHVVVPAQADPVRSAHRRHDGGRATIAARSVGPPLDRAWRRSTRRCARWPSRVSQSSSWVVEVGRAR